MTDTSDRSRSKRVDATKPLQPEYVTREREDVAESAESLRRDAVEAAIWGMPLVAFDAMRQAFLRDVGGQYNDIAYFSKPADWRFQVTTPNASSRYVYTNFNLTDGPAVLDVPPAVGAGLFGSINDAWQAPVADVGPAGEDEGHGGKYLLVPPGYEHAAPAGYVVLPLTTYNGYCILRAIPATSSESDVAKALELVKKIRLYPLSEAEHPPEQRHLDIADKTFDGIAKFDDTFYDSLWRMVTEEGTQQTRDADAIRYLTAIGIERGKPFNPDTATRAILKSAISEAHARFMEGNKQIIPYWPDSRWGSVSYLEPGTKTGFTFETEGRVDVTARANMFYLACAPPKKLGAASFYLAATTDAAQKPLDGGASYRLRVPANVPAKQFWAVTVYDLETAGFIRGSPRVELNSYQNPETNSDGSVDVYFGATAPAGKEANWVHTAPGKTWFAFFRFYGPDAPLFDKTWVLPNIEVAT